MKFLFLVFALPLFGSYIGNPASPAIMNTGIFSVRNTFIKGTSGYIADYTFNKNYKASQTDPDFNPNSALKKFGIHSQMASLSVILLERLEFFAYMGGSKEKAKLGKEPTLSESLDLLFDFSSSYHFSWATGAKVVFLKWGETYLCGDFTYFKVPSSSSSYFKFFNRLNLPLIEKQEFHMKEWQVSAALASRFWFITPYFGGIYLNSRLHINSGPETGSINYKNDDKFGWFYGFTISLTGRFHLSFERRQRTESSYGFSTIAVF